MGVEAVQTVRRRRQRGDRAHIGRVIQVALPLADARKQGGRLLSHVDAGVIRLRRLLPLGRDRVDLGRALAVVYQQVDLDRGALGRLAVFAPLDDHDLLILPQAGVPVDKPEDRLPARLLEQLKLQRRAEPPLRLLAELLDERNMHVRLLHVEHPRPVLLRPPDFVQQHRAQQAHLAARRDLAGQHRAGVLLEPVLALRRGRFLRLAHHAAQQPLARHAGISHPAVSPFCAGPLQAHGAACHAGSALCTAGGAEPCRIRPCC